MMRGKIVQSLDSGFESAYVAVELNVLTLCYTYTLSVLCEHLLTIRKYEFRNAG